MIVRRPRLSAPRLFAAGVTAYGLGLLAWLRWPSFGESFIGKFVGIPPFSIYVLEHFGAPGLTDRSDCNWMWCKPTRFGIVFTTTVWLVVAWFVSVGVARLSRSTRNPTGGLSESPKRRSTQPRE
jgi:hypothetical protein